MLLLLDALVLMIVGTAGYFAIKRIIESGDKAEKPAPKKEERYDPPIQADLPIGGPERRIRCHDIGNFYDEIGRPTEIGTQVEVNMQSGMVAIYELVHKERAPGVDWNWYDLDFIRYKDSPSSSPNRT